VSHVFLVPGLAVKNTSRLAGPAPSGPLIDSDGLPLVEISFTATILKRGIYQVSCLHSRDLKLAQNMILISVRGFVFLLVRHSVDESYGRPIATHELLIVRRLF